MKKWFIRNKYLFNLGLIYSLAFVSMFFGTSILENIHLHYIRYKAKDVVTLLNERGGGGTGFLVKAKSGKRFILTNNHICDSANNKPLIAIYRGDSYLVPVIKSYDLNDLCVVEAPSSARSNLDIASDVSNGDRVYSIGHPLLEPITVTQGELSSNVTIEIEVGVNVTVDQCSGVTYRIVSLEDNPFAGFFGIKNVCIRRLESKSSTVNILPGNSGSPTVNIYGNVVAVVFAANDSGVHSYHVPLEHIKNFLGQL